MVICIHFLNFLNNIFTLDDTPKYINLVIQIWDWCSCYKYIKSSTIMFCLGSTKHKCFMLQTGYKVSIIFYPRSPIFCSFRPFLFTAVDNKVLNNTIKLHPIKVALRTAINEFFNNFRRAILVKLNSYQALCGAYELSDT
nr:hypothetical protein Iba_chr01fCG8240 [Ipomoea batatas]GME12506.1 hypothetical protein Iba_scaffold13890CG0010 [Ipomoea batatas]